jgi:hypothetical protein
MLMAALATAPVVTAAAVAQHRAHRAGASRRGAPWVGQALPAQHPLPQHRLALAWPGPTLVQPLRAPVGLGVWEVTPPAPVWRLRLLLLARLPRPAAQAATAAAAGALQGPRHPRPHHPAGSSSSRRQHSSRLCSFPPRTFARHQGPWFPWDWEAAAAPAPAAGPADTLAQAQRLQRSSSRDAQWVQGPHLPTAATTAVMVHCRRPPLKPAATAAPGSRDRQRHPAPAMAAAATAVCSRCSSSSSVLGPLTGQCTP